MRSLPVVLALLALGCPSKENPEYSDTASESGSSGAESTGLDAGTSSSGDASSTSTSSTTSGTGSSGTGSSATALRIFLSSVTYSGDLGGLEGADEKCNAVATAAGLGGQWMAWVSDDVAGVDAIDRIEGEGPWIRVDDVEVFPNRATLMARPSDLLDIDEDGDEFGEATLSVWTGTRSDGSAGASCAGFTDETTSGVIGNPRTPETWTGGSAGPCGVQRHLYCFEHP
jgi:hypothetical protein